MHGSNSFFILNVTPNCSITMWDINMRDCALVTYRIDHILPPMDVHLANGTSKPTLMTLGLIFSYELN
jgi:hypothetical protein